MSLHDPSTRLAFSTLACPGWTPQRVVEAANRYGYRGVELRLLGDDTIGPDLPADLRAAVATAFATAQLPIVAVDTSLCVVNGNKRDIVAMAELAHAWESPLLRVFGGGLTEDLEHRTAQLQQAAELLAEVAPAAERLGVHIAVETHDDFSDATVLAELLAMVPHPSIGAVWDTHHPHRMGQDPATVLRALGDRLMLVQIKDARRNDNRSEGWDLVPLGEGEIANREALRLLTKARYTGWLSVEWEKKWHPELADADTALPQQRAILEKWLAEP